MDAHAILGLAEDANPDEIKRAYRRLAMRWHPDRNADPAANERFKEIRAAYDLLTSVDEEIETLEADPEPAPAAPPDEPARPPQAADIRLTLHLDLVFAAQGGTTSVRYSRGVACSTCAGTGEYGMMRTRFCAACHGSGRVRDVQRVLVACGECTGRGFFKERICPDCAGSGREIDDMVLEVRVPAGMLSGDELRLAGQGEPGNDYLQAGDLYLTVVLNEHPDFALHGRDLHVTCPVSALAMLAGGEIEVPGLEGSFIWSLTPSRPEATDLRIPGRGYPGRGRHRAGDLVLRLQPQFPQALSGKQRRALLALDAALCEDRETHFPDWPG